MQRMSPHYPIISIILLPAILVSLFTYSPALLRLPPHPQQIMPSQTSRSMAQEAARLRQEENAMAAATLQKEKDVAAKDECNAKEASKKSNAVAVTPKNINKTIHTEAPTVVSPPSVPDLTSLLTGHISREGGQPGVDSVATTDIAATNSGANSTATTDMDTTPPVKDPADDNVKSPKKKKSKKLKSTKQDKSLKCDCSDSSLKKSSFGTPAVVATSSAKEYKFGWVF